MVTIFALRSAAQPYLPQGSTKRASKFLDGPLWKASRRWEIRHAYQNRSPKVFRQNREGKMKLTILFVVVVGAVLVWWLKAAKPKRRI